MTYERLLQSVATETGLPLQDVELVLRLFLQQVKEGVRQTGAPIELPGFCVVRLDQELRRMPDEGGLPKVMPVQVVCIRATDNWRSRA